MTRKGLVKEHLLQIISVTTQIAISRRVSRFNSSSGTAKKHEGAGEQGMTDPHRWRGDGARIRLEI